MVTATFTFEVTILYFVAANVLAILAYVLFVKNKARQHQRHTRRVTRAIITYLRITEAKISVKCISLEKNENFIAFIESEPMKRFRLSHLVEAALRDHVRATCGVELDRIYWRFIVIEKIAKGNNEYMRESLRSMVISKYEISDGSLEMFEEANKAAGYS